MVSETSIKEGAAPTGAKGRGGRKGLLLSRNLALSGRNVTCCSRSRADFKNSRMSRNDLFVPIAVVLYVRSNLILRSPFGLARCPNLAWPFFDIIRHNSTRQATFFQALSRKHKIFTNTTIPHAANLYLSVVAFIFAPHSSQPCHNVRHSNHTRR
jgi:hypothetical protein